MTKLDIFIISIKGYRTILLRKLSTFSYDINVTKLSLSATLLCLIYYSLAFAFDLIEAFACELRLVCIFIRFYLSIGIKY